MPPSKHIELTEIEIQSVRSFSEVTNQMHLRILPLATRTMVSAAVHGNYKATEELASLMWANLKKEYALSITFSELEKFILLDLLNGDVPYITELKGEIYYGSVSMQKNIGKRK